MAIKKQDFYEGAALQQLVRTGKITSVRYEPPLYIFNENVAVLLKYSTKGRSPWGFTFVTEDHELLKERSALSRMIIGLICGHDGVAAIEYDDFACVAQQRDAGCHISCHRKHGQHYRIKGPNGSLQRKIPPSVWSKLLND